MHRHDPSQWTSRERDLWQRISAHSFEDPTLPLDFCARLAREQGWRRDEARAAIEEYRRFCFLAVTCEHAVTPSEAVDEVWHLHLTYTRDYWEHFCVEVLGRPLHHGPTRGLREDVRRHHEDYALTLESYEHGFGAPPERWWPGTRERFADARRWRRVDTSLHLVLPRPRLDARWLAPLIVAVVGAAVAPLALAQSESPLDLTGPRFLLLYLALLVVSFVAASVWRTSLRAGEERGGGTPDSLGVAYLLGGAQRALDAAAAEGLAHKHLVWQPDQQALARDFGPERPRPELQPLLDALIGARDGKVSPAVAQAATRDVAHKLRQRGLLLDDAAASRARWLPTLLPVALIVLGAAKVVIGLSRDKPVLFLVMLIIATVIALIVFIAKAPARSRAGDRAVRQARRDNARAARAPTSRDMGMAVALLGTAALSGSAFAAYHQARQPVSSGGGDSSSSSSSSDSSSDGGSGCSSSGCGGCGGGGGD